MTSEGELKLQESIYRDAHRKLVDAHSQFDEDVKNLYQVILYRSKHSKHIIRIIFIMSYMYNTNTL